MEVAIEEGGKSTKSNYVKHLIDNSDSPSIQKIVEGRVYGCFFIIDRDPRIKCIVNKHLCPTKYTTLYVRMAYTNSTPCITLL